MDYLVAIDFHCQVHDKLFNAVLIDVHQFRQAPKAEKTRADKVERWGHDLYVEDEQKPREEWEKEKVIFLLPPPLSLSACLSNNLLIVYMTALSISPPFSPPTSGQEEIKSKLSFYLKNALIHSVGFPYQIER